LFYFIEKYRQQKSPHYLGFTLALILFFLAHNVVALFGSVALLIYAFWRLYEGKLSTKALWQNYKKLIISFVLAFCAVAWFWIPALFERHYIVLNEVDISNDYHYHFLAFPQLITTNHTFGFSHIGSVDDLSFGLGIVFWLTIALTLCFFINLFLQKTSKKINQHNSFILMCIAMIAITIFMQLPISDFFWANLPLVNFVQFPWRLSLITLLFIIPLVIFIVSKNYKSIYLISTALLLSVVFMIAYQPRGFIFHIRETYLHYTQSTSTRQENRARLFDYDYRLRTAEREPIIVGVGTSEVQQWFGSATIYRLNLAQESLIIEDTMYFPGWQTRVSGQRIEYIDNEEIGGRIAFMLPAGEHDVKTSFTALTPARLIGQTLTALTLPVLIFFLWQTYRFHTKPN
jgi:hypothetical protein